MHVIVTHPNADFDAVASLLAAWHLYPDAIPLLPPTLNRNVRDFVTLYGNKLPFLHQRELGRSTITRLTVVDTQHIPDLKKLKSNVPVHIIDHHELHEPAPLGAVLSLTDTGSTVTLLVEQIREVSRRLSSIEATLLLLGIYEDTGSLTYGNTSPRDLQAAAWLLSKAHARLDIVREYLYYPMNDAQKSLYEQLVDQLETHTIHGHTIVIGMAIVDRYVEEISGLASRLRDLYQPEALFVLVQMTDHTQMVARSVTEAIDVDRIARHFAGGGHPRAAAALIKHRTLDDIKHDLTRLLYLEVQPALTVAQIMSKGVRTLAPTNTVREAADVIDRYGHEGFPVVDANTGKIVGILARREVDKALRHKLEGAAIRQFMKKGEYFVTPGDGIDAVQALMTTHQIGQVPVVENGGLIGIVTRTDLINLWQATGADQPTRVTLGEQLKKSLSSELFDMLCEGGELASGQGDALYIVGGFVRDLLLTMLMEDDPATKAKTSPRFDLDLVVEGDAISLAQHLQERNGGRVRSHSRFGTAKWILDSPIRFNPNSNSEPVYLNSLDFVTARTEFYRHPSALPEVEESSIRQDLHRRDFTINTLALRLTPNYFGELLDFYGGQSDLETRLLRVLHSLSFVEDPTRMLRAARLLARLEFLLEDRTAELLDDALDLLDRVSGERVVHELELIFKERHPAKALQQLDELGILAAIHPGLMVDTWLVKQLEELSSGLAGTPWSSIKPDTVHFIGLLAYSLAGDELDVLMERLNLRVQQRNTLRQVYAIKRGGDQIAKAQKSSDLYHLMEHTSDDARLIAWLALDDEAARQQIVRFQTELRDVSPLIDGHYLKTELGLQPGPIFKYILDTLRDACLDGQATTMDDEKAIVEQILAGQLTSE